jgi:hypothetical protein
LPYRWKMSLKQNLNLKIWVKLIDGIILEPELRLVYLSLI